MCLFRHSRAEAPCAFSTRLETCESPSAFFRLTGYVDGLEVAKAHGDFHPHGVFRLINIGVHDKLRRGKGYGTVMIHRLMEEAGRRDCNEFVFIGVANDNASAARLYSRMGATPRAIPHCSTRQDYVYLLPHGASGGRAESGGAPAR